MRQNLYHTLSDEFHTQEMKQIQKSSDWYCYFIQDDTFSQIGMVELSSRNIVDGCLTSPVAYLEGLYLLEAFRNQGIGSQVIQTVIDHCKQLGFSELATDTELNNVKAQNFYIQQGFEETDRIVEFRIPLNKNT